MRVDRRTFLRGAVGGAVTVLLPTHFATAAGAAEKAPLTMAGFSRYANTQFRFQVGGRTVTMPLKAVTDDRTAAARSVPGAGECFSLLFAGSLPPFRQGTYNVDHQAFGRVAMFVVPIGRRATGQDYQVVFNRCTV